ncbi:hypothetical protein OXB_3010 [Bacillus sp. OxB-1]|uniref:ORF6N domain-containing protein n=1 Tax=Bacillus sp. (strain OxB-1) TaxID=98228 RepID=UPI000581D4ED|nr:ORF6N domain-containing protein [Bacillus sp. OxB-1]BAQ11480.1 hypothetical protein OXB_3010 [Bacillus sp. OxB-1]
MDKPQVIEHASRRVLSTSQIAELFETDSKTITRNFQRNRNRYTAGVHYYVLVGEELKAFKTGRQNEDSLKYVSVLYLWTEQGALLLARSLNNDQAWQSYQMLIDKYYAIHTRGQRLEADDKMRTALPPAVKEAINHLESRVIALETQIQNSTLHSGEQRRLRNAVGERVYHLTKKEIGARPVIFRAIYSEMRERYEVDSYRDIKQSQLQDALRFVETWGGDSIEART